MRIISTDLTVCFETYTFIQSPLPRNTAHHTKGSAGCRLRPAGIFRHCAAGLTVCGRSATQPSIISSSVLFENFGKTIIRNDVPSHRPSRIPVNSLSAHTAASDRRSTSNARFHYVQDCLSKSSDIGSCPPEWKALANATAIICSSFPSDISPSAVNIDQHLMRLLITPDIISSKLPL